jgi:DNA-binding LacI/PurR family transcriptional regulator
LSVPEDLSVVGFDDIPFASFTHPALTTIAQPKRKMGQQAVQMALELMGAKDLGEHAASDVVVRGQLIVRESSGPVQNPKH